MKLYWGLRCDTLVFFGGSAEMLREISLKIVSESFCLGTVKKATHFLKPICFDALEGRPPDPLETWLDLPERMEMFFQLFSFGNRRFGFDLGAPKS